MASTVSTKRILFAEIYSDETRNPRVDYSDCEPNTQFNAEEYFGEVDLNKVKKTDESKELGFYEDVTMNGILVPIDVAQMSPADVATVKKLTNKTYKYRTIRGHRRLHCLTYASKYHKEWFKPGGKFEYVTANVHVGLTYDQELDLMIDQFGVKGLNAPEVYRAIRSLKLAGLKEKEISQRVHMSRGFVQRRLWITTFPDFVVDAWIDYVLKRGDEKTRVNLTDGRLVSLNIAANADRKEKTSLTDPKSKFMEAWDKILHPSSPAKKGGANDKDDDSKQKMMSRPDVEKMILTTGLDDIIVSTLKTVLRENDRGLDAVNAECILLRKKAAAYTDMLKTQKSTVVKTNVKTKKA